MSTSCITAQEKRRILFSIDFGTAFSSVVYYIDRRLPQERVSGLPLDKASFRIKEIKFWSDFQVSSQLAWNDIHGQWEWGYRVDLCIQEGQIAARDRIDMLKLCLERSDIGDGVRAQLSQQLKRLPPLAWEQLGQDNVKDPAERLISLYLRCLWQDSIRCASISGLDNYDIECWLSVPKLWSPEINQKMLDSAIRAGLPLNIQLNHEPEAAAFSCISELELDRLRQAGSPELDSESADIVTYRIAMEDKTLSISEGVRGTSKLCGSAILNQKFLEMFRSRVMFEDFRAASRAQRRQATAKHVEALELAALKEFEEKKKRFGHAIERSNNNPLLIKFPGVENAYDTSRNHVKGDSVPRDEIERLFNETLEEILEMVMEQVDHFNKKFGGTPGRRLERIYFVGGLSANQYMFDKFVAAYSGPSSLARYDIEITRPEAVSATLIARGALIKALHNPVGEKILTQSYGFVRREPYSPSIHSDRKVVEDFFEEDEDVVEGCMDFLCKLHGTIDLRQPVPFRSRGHRFIPVTGKALITETLYRSYTQYEDHISVKTTGIEKIGSLYLDFSKVDRRDLEVHTTTHKQIEYWHRLDYEVQLIFDGIRLVYKLIVPESGRWWGWDTNSKEPQTDDHWGNSLHVCKATIENVNAAFDVSGYRVTTDETSYKELAPPVRGVDASDHSSNHRRRDL